MFALGLLSWLYNRPLEGTIKFLESKFAEQARDHEGEHRGLPGRLELRRDHRGVLGPVRGQARASSNRAPTATSPATAPCPTAWSPRRGGPGCRCSSAPTRSRRPPTSCTSCPSTSGSGSARSRPRTRSRAWARRSAPSFGGALGVTHHLGPGHGAQGGDDRAGRLGRAAADHLRHPAGRAVHRHADQDRAGRPADGAVRPERRVAGRRCWPRPRRRTASTPRWRRSGSPPSTAPR